MATLTKTFTFAASAESWAATLGGATGLTSAWNSGFALWRAVRSGKNLSDGTPYIEWAGTWQDLGLAATDTVTAVNLDYDWVCNNYSTGAASTVGPAELRDSGGTLRNTFSTSQAYSSAGSTVTKSGTNQTGLSEIATTSIKLRIGTKPNTGSNNSAVNALHVDQIVVTITYTAGSSDVTGTSSLTATAATSSATGRVPTTGTSALTGTAATSSATGVETFTGTSAPTATAATTSATGVETFTGTSSLTATAATSSATGVETFTGTSALTATAATSSAEGTNTPPSDDRTGTSSLTATAATSSATGLETFTGTSALTAAAATTSATGIETFTGTSTLTAAPATSSASGTVSGDIPPDPTPEPPPFRGGDPELDEYLWRIAERRRTGTSHLRPAPARSAATGSVAIRITGESHVTASPPRRFGSARGILTITGTSHLVQKSPRLNSDGYAARSGSAELTLLTTLLDM